MSVLQKLTENITKKNVRKEVSALRAKWEETGLLEGLASDRSKDNLAILMENQAKELLREASTMAAGDVEGFAAVAFPIVRRVFGGLVANELVSVQPMSLPTGLIFFLDFTHTSTRLGSPANGSVYGGGVVGQQLTGGVSLSGSNAERGFYNLNNGYSSPTGSTSITWTVRASGTVGGGISNGTAAYTALGDRLVRYDPDLVSGSSIVCVSTAPLSSFDQLNLRNLVGISPTLAGQGILLRRLTQIDPVDSANVLAVVASTGSETANLLSSSFTGALTTTYPINDDFTAGVGLGSLVGTSTWGLENEAAIPEIDIKVDSVDIRAKTKKLKAKWTPELQQDINAYQNLDAEVELTQILSETIALEIDQELLEDLVTHAAAGTYYWSRRSGKFVDPTTGTTLSGGDFTGNISEWYESLIERVNDISAQIHRKTLRGGANFIVVGPETANILEFTAGFRASTTADEEMGEVGAVKVGSIRKKWDVYVDPYFFRNVILVGRKGSSFLESGYVYAPYVPLQVTPTIFGEDDFTPRKGVMTRYGKKMVRPDMYGLVVIMDFLG